MKGERAKPLCAAAALPETITAAAMKSSATASVQKMDSGPSLQKTSRLMLNAVIDLSHHNPPVDFGLAKAAGILGVIHKASQGARFADSMYPSRRRAAESAGVLFGAYHFGDGTDGKLQAEHFLNCAGDAPLLVLDFEENKTGPTMELGQAYEFIQTVHLATGRWPGLYAGFYLRQLLAGKPDAMLQNCWLWLAEYRTQPQSLPGWDSWTLWQYTDGDLGPEPRIIEGLPPCDRSFFNGDAAGLAALWKGQTP